MINTRVKILFTLLISIMFLGLDTFAACGGNIRTWNSTGNRNWTTNANWLPTDPPNTSSEDVVIINTGVNSRVNTDSTVGCVDVQSGFLEITSALTLTVTGDYFNAPSQNTVRMTNNDANLTMGGTSAQSLTINDDLRDLTISNPSEVTINGSFRILSDLEFVGSGKTYINGNIIQNNTANITTIPAGHTVVLKSGSVLYIRGDLVVNGVLKIEAGAYLQLYRNRSLTINSTGLIQLAGAPGNTAKIISEAANRYFSFNMNGTLIADNFVIQRTDSSGLNVSGTVSQLSNGEFRGISANGHAMSLSASASLPSAMNTIGFFNDDNRNNVKNINATSYSGAVSTISNYSGDVAGTAFETDPSAKITWNTPAITEVSVVNDTETGEPATFMDATDEFTFAEFAFALTQNDVATDITQVQLTMTGTASVSDFEYIEAYLDTNGNCNYNAANDTSIGYLSFSGTPAKATINLNPGDLTTSSPSTPTCLIIRAKASASPTDQKTARFGIMSSTDIVNSNSYPISTTSGAPLETGFSTMRNNNYTTWDGGVNALWTTAGNWRGNNIPSSTRDCQIGAALNPLQINTTPVACSNATLQTNGSINWNSTSNIFEIYSNLDIQSNFTFSNAANSSFSFVGTAGQSFSSETIFPGSITLNNSGGSGNNLLTILKDTEVLGNFICTNGILSIPSGVTFKVGGNITMASGCGIEVLDGGTLAIGNLKTLTINSGATLNLAGSAAQKANITSTTTLGTYEVIVNGSIEANYYSFSNLGTNGVSIEAGATIHATNNLKNGSFLNPINSNSTLLKLKRQIPGNTLSGMVFNLNGSSAASITNIDTTGAAAATLIISSYSGDIAGPSYDTDPNYVIDWQGQTNTIELVTESTSPSTVTVGNTYNMGIYSLKQTLPGASYSDTDITSIKLTLTGSGNATSIQNVSLYTDTDCDGLSGTLIGTNTFSGSPASTTFSIAPSNFTIPADLVTTQKRCFYVTYEINSSATNASTVGVQIASSADIINSQGYAFSSAAAPPLSLGTPSIIDAPTTTIWTGTANTSWTNTSNWTSGVPDLTKTCQIPNTSNTPVISTSVNCKNLDITTGALTITAAGNLNLYGNLTNSGTISQTGSITIQDGGLALNHNISNPNTMPSLTISKSGGGSVVVSGTSLTINNLNFSGSNFIVEVGTGRKLILPNGVNITSGELRLVNSGTLEIGSSQTINVNGGTFRTAGGNSTFPQNTSGLAKIIVQGGSGTWSFNATSGNVNLIGFQMDRLSPNGLVIGGTTNLLNLSGGQFTNLSASYASVKAIQINTSGSIPATASNIAWNWGNLNLFDPANANTPDNTQAYKLITSTGCNGSSIDFTGWTGDWFETTTTFDVASKISTTNCNITMSNASSAVSLKSLVATGYADAVQILWETNTEINHIGFNVYRSNATSTTFQQINPVILKNINNSGQAKGSYAFSDYDVTDTKTYYYYVEDIDTSGVRRLHGPVWATVDSTKSNAPIPGAGDNSGSNPNDSDDGDSVSPYPIENPGYQDLGNGAVIISQTTKAIRLEITPPVPVTTISSWNTSFQDISVTGYSKLDKVNYPELPVRVILIDVNEFATTANLINAAITNTMTTGFNISPAPSYSLIGNTLTPSYSADATAYSSISAYPSAFFEIDPNLIKEGHKKYLKVVINPNLFMASTNSIDRLDKLVLDIGLDGDDWNNTIPSTDFEVSTNSVANTIKASINKTGIYEISYSDLVASNVESPLYNEDISDLRAYHNEIEIPLEVISSDSLFNSGDKLRFIISKLNSPIEHITISSIDIKSSASSPLRIEELNSTPLGEYVIDENTFYETVNYEQNLVYVDGQSLGDTEDHFFWKHIQNYSGYEKFTTTFTTTNFDLLNDENVKISFKIKGSPGYWGSDFYHHLQFRINGIDISDVVIQDNKRHTIDFYVNSDDIINGVNSLELEVLGTFAQNSDYDRVYIDSFEVSYVNDSSILDNKAHYTTWELDADFKLSGFTDSSISIYEKIDNQTIRKLTSPSITTPNGGTSYDLEFYLNEETNTLGNKEIFSTTSTNFLKPIALTINPGLVNPIKDQQGAKLIIIGDKNLLDAAYSFTQHRIDQGISVYTITPEAVYNEFSSGKKDAQAINDFLKFAKNNWSIKPQYLILLGDSTWDPLNHNTASVTSSDIVATSKGVIPSAMNVGRFMEFFADNILSKIDNTYQLSIGRIPTNKPEVIENYFEKVISYESGESIPANLKKVSFIADEDQGYYENFELKSEQFASTLSSFSSNIIKRSSYASKVLTRDAITDEFSADNYIISMLGHGASDRFGDGIILNSHISSLTNTTYPIVLMWNCETGYFYGSSKSEVSFGESLILNKDGGGIVYIGPTTQTTPTAQYNFANNFYSNLEQELTSFYTGQRIGDILVKTQNALKTRTYELDIINSTIILGDPSLKIPESMFKARPPAPKIIKKGGGCSAFAAGSSQLPWYSGVLEILFSFLSVYIFRRIKYNRG